MEKQPSEHSGTLDRKTSIDSGGAEPMNTDNSKSDLEIIEIKQVIIAKPGPVVKKIKIESKKDPVMPVLEKQMKPKTVPKTVVSEQVPESSSRRPSRRAAQEAAKKISNSVRNMSNVDTASDVASPASVTQPTPRGRQRVLTQVRGPTRPLKQWHLLKVPPADLDVVLECHEELLSTVQAEAMLKAQLEYNMVMKTLRQLKESNVRVIEVDKDADTQRPVPPLSISKKSSVALSKRSGITVSTVKGKGPKLHAAMKQPNVITVTPIKVPGAVPIRLTTAFSPMSPSSPAPILS